MENPSEEKPKKHRARRKKEETPSPAKGLLDALAFIKPAQKKGDFCLVTNHWMVAANDILTIATPVQEDLEACPQTHKFEEVLKQVSEEMSITQLSSTELSVSSGGMKVVVPCTANAPVITGPDPQGGPATDALKWALKDLAAIVDEKSDEAYKAAVLIHEDKCVGTDGHVLLEIEHGSALPQNVLVPKAACLAVAKAKKPLTGFGYSGPSCTFYFEDGSLIKTQLFNQEYPQWSKALDAEPDSAASATNKDFFEAVATIGSMTEDSNVYFQNSQVMSDKKGFCTYELPIIAPSEPIGFNSAYIKKVKSSMQDVVFDPENSRMFFFSDRRRGMLMAVSEETEV